MQAVYIGSKKAFEKVKKKLKPNWENYKNKIVLIQNDVLNETIPWRDEFEILHFKGLKFLEELVMFHKPTRYLLLAGKFFSKQQLI